MQKNTDRLSTPVRLMIAPDDTTILNAPEISRTLGVDIAAYACAWTPIGGGYFVLDRSLSDPMPEQH